MMSTAWMTKPQTLSIRLVTVAAPPSTPLRSKKRTSSVTLAAELGTARAMNWIGVLEHQDGPVPDGLESKAPRVEKACAAWMNGDMKMP